MVPNNIVFDQHSQNLFLSGHLHSPRGLQLLLQDGLRHHRPPGYWQNAPSPPASLLPTPLIQGGSPTGKKGRESLKDWPLSLHRFLFPMSANSRHNKDFLITLFFFYHAKAILAWVPFLANLPRHRQLYVMTRSMRVPACLLQVLRACFSQHGNALTQGYRAWRRSHIHHPPWILFLPIPPSLMHDS